MIMAIMLLSKHCFTVVYKINVYAVCALYTGVVTVFTFCTRRILDNCKMIIHICSSVVKNNPRSKTN